jgi:hypothetical protein
MRFKLKAERGEQALHLMSLLPENIWKMITIRYQPKIRECEVVLEMIPPMELEEIRNYLRRVPGGLLMVQTVQLEEDYTGEPDVNLS